VGQNRLAVEAYIDQFLAARRMPEVRRQDVRSGVLRVLATHGLGADDGQLYFDANSGRLRFKQGKHHPKMQTSSPTLISTAI
jgi:hypothetical protein